jgi:hypothetical protein
MIYFTIKQAPTLSEPVSSKPRARLAGENLHRFFSIGIHKIRYASDLGKIITP